MHAEHLAGTGDTAAATQQVAQLAQLVTKIDPEDGAPTAAEQLDFLTAKLQETPPGAPTDPKAC